MPSELTIFAAQYLVFIEALLAAGIIVGVLRFRPRTDWLRWAVLTAVTLVLAYLLAKIGSAVYNDPRPFMTDHTRPLISHAADNGFPSDHALLAAVLVAAVAFARPLLAIPVAILAVLVDWARVGAGLHHVTDVAGSTLFVALGAAIALTLAPTIVQLVTPYLPDWILPTSPASGQKSA